MLGEIKDAYERRTYLNIKGGAIVKRTEKGEENYSFVEGIVEAITQRERVFHDEKITYWYIDIRGEANELYSLAFPYYSNTFKSIVLQLASDDGLDALHSGAPIRIAPYQKDGHDKVQVHALDKKLSWVTRELPPIVDVQVGAKVVKDDTERMKLINNLVTGIRATLPTRRQRERLAQKVGK